MPRRPKIAEALELSVDPSLADIKRFLSKVKVSGECWLWKGYVDPNGYGWFCYQGRNVPATRFAYATFKGVIPARHHAHHTDKCPHHNCIRPSHLWAITKKENDSDGGKRRHGQQGLFNERNGN